MPHNSRPNLTALRAAERFTRLRAAGVPMILTPAEAWHLTGGVLGSARGYGSAESPEQAMGVPLSRVARDVPDAEAFLPDYRAVFPTTS